MRDVEGQPVACRVQIRGHSKLAVQIEGRGSEIVVHRDTQWATLLEAAVDSS